ncbi:hypothetical protein SAY87_006756 [Trapa incisa]|uniref:Uncharacterized protein n=1 Tax=Trapa incisa TaxID=236973 RepID=A0AAN7K1Q0_9MYRT|nr:hypothetical protein SAY87_006756 [Trapa incisa]
MRSAQSETRIRSADAGPSSGDSSCPDWPTYVYEILQKLLHCFHWIVPGYIMGGENRSKEKARLRKGISILIGTPGCVLEIDYLKDLERHGVKLTEYPIIKVLESFPLYGKKFHAKSFVTMGSISSECSQIICFN